MFSLKEHTALVTGSTKGIGRAIAAGLKEMGAGVIFHGRHPAFEGLADEDRYVAADLLDEAGPSRLIEGAFGALPEPDLLVCNAGSFFDAPFLEMTEEKWNKTINLNLRSVYFLIQRFAQRLIGKNRRGAVVIISSTNGFQAEYDSSAYDTSKGGLVMMTKSLAMSLADHGIRVNGVAPGLIYTPLTMPGLGDKSWVEHYERKTLMGRIGDPEDCAGAVAYLLSDAAKYVTGEIIVVDGGLTVGQIGRMESRSFLR